MWTHAHMCACGHIRRGVSEWLMGMEKGAWALHHAPHPILRQAWWLEDQHSFALEENYYDP